MIAAAGRGILGGFALAAGIVAGVVHVARREKQRDLSAMYVAQHAAEIGS